MTTLSVSPTAPSCTTFGFASSPDRSRTTLSVPTTFGGTETTTSTDRWFV
jgi:hypothetical protein